MKKNQCDYTNVNKLCYIKTGIDMNIGDKGHRPMREKINNKNYQKTSRTVKMCSTRITSPSFFT